ncbi:PREDICTED: uncharacterized protein LOC109222031 [Nicotiana attenuata]|uniref:uncharacterized protein LOC109222031 n=1 Tax=Nicotiana attenuata TaxID=49451 RepID=UPI0009054FCA|nr:PREDICTED: uncharacterized protein LOC109222031 [Nicotiana attenuata]
MANGEETSTGTSTATNIDHHHPLYLQPCDTPGSSLISIQLTGSENYALWSRSMKIAQIGKSKLGFVDGRCTKDKFDRSLHELWEKCNAIVLSWIMNAVSTELLSGIVYKSNAHKVWTDMKDKYDKVDGSRIFFLHKEIATLSQGISLVSAYFSKLTDLWEEYDALMPCPGCDCPESKSYFEHFEYQRLLQFLMGLNETYSQPRSQILMMSPVPTVNKAYSMIVSEESQRALGKFSQSIDIGNGTTLFTNKGMNSANNYKPRRGNLFCGYCNYKEHTRDTCFKLHGYPADFKMRKKTTGFPQRPMANATIHEEQQSMTKQVTNTTTQEAQQVINTSAANVAQRGSPIMFTQEQYDQILKLISTGTGENESFAGTSKTFVANEKVKDENRIVDSGATNHMVHTRELLDKINTDILGNVPKVYLPDGSSLDVECTRESRIGENSIVKNVLYVLNFKYNLLSVSKHTRDLRCFISFYPDFWIMQDLHSGKVKGIGKELEGLNNLQHQKLEAKAANVHLQKSTVHEVDLKVWHGRLGHSLDRVVKQIPNMKFKASSDGTKECTICPLARQGRLSFPKSTIIRSDNGSEFFNSECHILFQSYGMIHQSSCVHTPQQNGVVERKQRHILEVARAIRLQGYLPFKFWGECVQATIYVINRLPLSVLSGKSSFEMLYGRVPSLQHLRTIGCLCFAKVVGEKDKFAARSVGAVDVKFMEHIFPFQLLKEGKLQLFPNGVLHYPVTTDAIPVQINTHDDDASLSAMPPVADNHTADTQPSLPLPLFSEDTPAQQSPPSE